MPGHELADAFEQRLFAAGVAERQVFGKQLLIEFSADFWMLQQRFDLRSKGEKAAVPEVVEGFDTQTITRAQQSFVLPVPDGEGKHAAETREALVAVLLVGMNDGFSVAMALIAVSSGFELGTDVGVIEDFAVVGDPQRFVLVGHRLAAGGEVNDAQTTVAEGDFALHIKPGAIRTAVRDDVRHGTDHARVGGVAVGTKNSRYAAHIISFALLPERGAGRSRAEEAHCITMGWGAAGSLQSPVCSHERRKSKPGHRNPPRRKKIRPGGWKHPASLP